MNEEIKGVTDRFTLTMDSSRPSKSDFLLMSTKILSVLHIYESEVSNLVEISHRKYSYIPPVGYRWNE